MNKIKLTSRLVLVLAILLGSAAIAQAGLYRVGPSDLPSPPGHGFPLWYQDFNGLALDICNPTTVDQLTPCLLAPAPGEPLPTLPFQFNSNWPAEQFWFSFSASNLDIPSPDGGTQGVLVEGAIEAAFAVDRPIPAPGEQISFARIRVRFDAPVDGTYTVTHPYGVDILPASAGERVFFTEDIGIGANGDFSGALGGRIGPFLTPVNALGVPLAPVTISGRRFLTDGAAEVLVTGSPFETNYAEVCVDNPGGLDGNAGTAGDSCVRTELFSVIGMLHDGAIASPLSVPRASYSRIGTTAKVDVFANASAGPLSATPILSFSGTGLLGSYLMVSNSLGQSYGQAIPTDACTIPAQVMITNSSDNPPSSSFHPVLDEVTITGATYDFNARTLTVRATSSDKGHPGNSNCEAIPVPVLSLDGFPVSPQPLPQPPPVIVVTQTSPDPLAIGDLSSTQILVEGLTVPPPAVTVLSNRGGSATLDIVTLVGAGSQAGAPVAVDDPAITEAGVSIPISVLNNDSGNKAPSTVRIVSLPAHGSAVVDTAGVVTYTPTPVFVGQDTFTYTVRSAPAPAGLESNVATVTVTINAGAGGPAPIAVDDPGPFTVQVNAALTIPFASLTANDSPNGGIIDPTSIRIEAMTGGTAVANPATGIVTYTAGAVAGNNFGFSYTVANTNNQRSAPAFVTIAVLPATDVLTITLARFRSGRLRWDVSGTATVPGPLNTVAVSLVRGGVTIGTIGTVPVDAVGGWTLRAEPSNVIAINGDQVRATSSAGGSATLAVQVRQ